MQPDIKELLFRLTGQAYTISVNVLFIDFAGGVYQGLFLSQLWYWQGKVGDGKYFAKTYSDWHKEIRVNKKVLMKTSEQFKELGILETKVKKFAGSPTVHYMLNTDKAIELLTEFCNNEKVQNGIMESAEMELSNMPESNYPLTKNTTKNTNIVVKEKRKKTKVVKRSAPANEPPQDTTTTPDLDRSVMTVKSELMWQMDYTNKPELTAKLTEWAYNEILQQIPAVCAKHGKSYTVEQLQAWVRQQLTTDKVNVAKTQFSMYGEPMHSDTVKHLVNRCNWQLTNRGGLDLLQVGDKAKKVVNNYSSPF